MPRYNVSAELTVDDRSPFAYVEADSEEEARELAREIYGTHDAWEFHVADGSVEVFVSLAEPVDNASDAEAQPMSESGPTDPGLVPAAPDDQAGVIETIMQSIELAEQIPWPQDKQPIWTLPMVVTLRDRIIELEAEVVHNASDADITQGEKQ